VRIEDFDYELPTELIAQTPVEPRDSARLLVDQGSSLALHRQVKDLVEFCRPGDVVVVNDTKVIPARLRLVRESGGAAEVLLLEQDSVAPSKWEALIRPAKRLKLGETLFASDNSEVVRIGERTKAGDTFIVELVGQTRDDSRNCLKNLARCLCLHISKHDSGRQTDIRRFTPTDLRLLLRQQQDCISRQNYCQI